jgi:hypothetical protein
MKIGIAAVDYHIARRQKSGQLRYNRVGNIAGRDHHPDYSRRSERFNQGAQRMHSLASQRRRRFDRFGIHIEDNRLVPPLLQAGYHVETHLPEPDKSQRHETSVSKRSTLIIGSLRPDCTTTP